MAAHTAETSPQPVFTLRFAAATGIVFAAVLILFSQAADWYGLREAPIVAPDCFDAAEPLTLAAEQPLWLAKRDVFGAEYLLAEQQGRIPPETDPNSLKVAEAQQACLPASCSGEAMTAYRSALLRYLSEMTDRLRRMQEVGGDAGRVYVLWLYNRPIDVAIRNGLRERYSAGLFDPRAQAWRAIGDSVSILLFKGVGAMKACVRG